MWRGTDEEDACWGWLARRAEMAALVNDGVLIATVAGCTRGALAHTNNQQNGQIQSESPAAIQPQVGSQLGWHCSPHGPTPLARASLENTRCARLHLATRDHLRSPCWRSLAGGTAKKQLKCSTADRGVAVV